MDKKFALVSQISMTLLMAAVMSGLLGLIFSGGFLIEWLARWPLQCIVAWPIAFVVTMVAWPIAMKLATQTLSRGGHAKG